MPDIICPHCKTTFQVNESDYADLLQQVRGAEFEKELRQRQEILEKEKAEAVKLAEAKTKNNLQQDLSEKETQIVKLQAQKQAEVAELKAKLAQLETQKQLEVTKAVSAVEKERDTLAVELRAKEYKSKVNEAALKEKYESALALRTEEIERLKDMKAKLSTKMVGETLEQHCEVEFNRLRATGFARAYFEKDNDAKSGSKGDYIFRETDENGVEIVSIMFEMKNENDTTATKHKNEDFFKELDKDRNEKKCEYAVLVTLLESESELYNAGIVDVSYKFPKMYAVRPQFFIPIIALLRNAALNSLTYKKELALVKNQNLDVAHFEEDLENWKAGFAKNVAHAASKYKEAIESIDKSIANLQKTRDALLMSEKHLLTANSKAEDISVKKLTRNNPTMAEKLGVG